MTPQTDATPLRQHLGHLDWIRAPSLFSFVFSSWLQPPLRAKGVATYIWHKSLGDRDCVAIYICPLPVWHHGRGICSW